MITVISWSKDRAAQLDLTLSSFKKYVKEWSSFSVNIIYTYSTENHQKAYELVKSYHPEFNWIKEKNLRSDTIDTLITAKNEYISFMVDDDVFVDYMSIEDEEFKTFFSDSDIACISPRIAPYVNFCYTQNKPQPPPTFVRKNVWDWTTAIYDWGYPVSVAAFHVFRKSDLSFIEKMPFSGVNTLEGNMEGNYPRNRKLMICYDHSKCITSTINRVQQENANRTTNSHPIEYLNNEFLSGKRLSCDINNNLTINMCHGPVTIEWKNYEI